MVKRMMHTYMESIFNYLKDHPQAEDKEIVTFMVARYAANPASVYQAIKAVKLRQEKPEAAFQKTEYEARTAKEETEESLKAQWGNVKVVDEE